MARTIWQIQEDLSSAVTAALSAYHDKKNEIAAQREPENVAYLDQMDNGSRMNVLNKQKMEKAQGLPEEAREAYREALANHREEIAKRAAKIKADLFHVENVEAVAVAASAGDDVLLGLLDHAADAGQTDLAKAIFLTATKRERGDVIKEYLDRVAPDARELYEELQAVPGDDVFARQEQAVNQIIPDISIEDLTPQTTPVY